MLTWEELWVRYVGLGGMLGMDDMTTYLLGTGGVTRLEHNVLAHALNEELIETGQDSRVAYRDR